MDILHTIAAIQLILLTQSKMQNAEITRKAPNAPRKVKPTQPRIVSIGARPAMRGNNPPCRLFGEFCSTISEGFQEAHADDKQDDA